MFNNRLKKILIIFFIICTSTPTYGSNYGSFFSIKNNIKTIISSIPINRRLIGIVVLLMGGYAAWRYFNKNELTENPSKDDLEKISNKTNNQIFYPSRKTNPIEKQFQINDVVTIIDAETSIEMASIDKEMYKKITSDPNYLKNIDSTIEIINLSPKQLYLKSIGIIREIIDNTMIIEVMTETMSNTLPCSSYIAIEKQHVKKCILKQLSKNKDLKEGVQVRIKLKSEFLKNNTLSLNTLNKDNQRQRWSEDLYDERFDSQEYYIATVKQCKKDTENMDVDLYLHWREKITLPDLLISVNKNHAEIIFYK